MSAPICPLNRTTCQTAIGQPEQYGPLRDTEFRATRANYLQWWRAREADDFRTAVATRVRTLPALHHRPFLPGTCTYFLIGMPALRLGVFEEPRRRRRLIIGSMIFGVASWAIANWTLGNRLLAWYVPPPTLPPPIRVILDWAPQTFHLLRVDWLAFTYVGAAYAPLAALGLFGINGLLCRWRLARFQYGPLEWLWQCITWARWQRLRIPVPAGIPEGPPDAVPVAL